VEEWDKAFAVNVRGAWLCARAVFPYMREQLYGKIVNIASTIVRRCVTGFLRYVTSKLVTGQGVLVNGGAWFQ
jgi:3-oxoacyl-[acyl-carrier protein] reductase